jgi:hypothetical protein
MRVTEIYERLEVKVILDLRLVESLGLGLICLLLKV